MLGQQSIGCQLIMGDVTGIVEMDRRDNDVTNGALALASLVELGPIKSACDSREHAESLRQLRLQHHSPEQCR